MDRKPYPTDVTDGQWRLIEPSIPPPKSGGRPREVDTREVLNAILYVLRTDSAWRHVSHDLPPRETVYCYFLCWIDDGTWTRIHELLRARVRRKAGKNPTLSVGIIDSHLAFPP